MGNLYFNILTSLALIGATHVLSHPLEHQVLTTAENLKNLTEESYRLPKDIVPITYDVWMYTRLGLEDFSYHGHVDIALRVLNVTDTIIVHNDNLTIEKDKTFVIYTSGEVYDLINIDSQDYDTERQFYIVKLKSMIHPGKYVVRLYFKGIVLDDVFGFYRTSYEVKGSKRYMGVTQFSPTYARRAFPCMDEPHLKANFTLHIGHTQYESVTSNTEIENTSAFLNDSSYYITSFKQTPKMSTYIVGWAIHNFTAETSNTSKSFKIWTRPTMKHSGSLSLNLGQSIYASLKDWLVVENPIRKMDQFAVPDFNFNAMENWGLITFRESVALYGEDETPTRVMISGLTTLSHEYAHTWFGNLVTPMFWNFAWLKEGFASYFQYFALSLIKPEWKMMDVFVVDTLQPTLLLDSVQHNRTMNGQEVGSPANIMGTLDFVSYRKGASVIRMLSHVMGTSLFQKALQSYLSDMSFKAATPYDLYEYFQTAFNESGRPKLDIRNFMESWTTQTGYPVVNVNRNYTSGDLMISQERFYQNQSQSDKDNKISRWCIPLTFATQSSIADFSNPLVLSWLFPENASLSIGSFKAEDWVILNVQQVGYYRVNYDSNNWRKLIDYLTSKDFEKINPVNRASLLDDSFNLARSGYIDYCIPFNLSRYLIQEQKYVPWLAAWNNLKFIDFMLSNIPSTQQTFQRYVRSLLEPLYKKFSFSEAPHEDWTTKLHRELILSASCSVNNTHCLRTSKTLFGSWIGSTNKTILKDIKSVVYCQGVSEGDEADWYAIWDKLLHTELHTEQELLFRALGCTRNANLIDKYLNWAISIDSGIRKQYRILAFNAVLDGHSTNINKVLEFTCHNHKKIIEQIGDSFLNKVISAIGNKITQKNQVEKLRKFADENADNLGNTLAGVKQAVLSATANVNWIRKYSNEIARCLA